MAPFFITPTHLLFLLERLVNLHKPLVFLTFSALVRLGTLDCPGKESN